MARKPQRNYVRNGRGVAYPQEKVKRAKKLLRRKQAGLKISLREIAIRCGVRSPATILNWSRQKMDQDSICYRKHQKAHNRLLSDAQEKVVSGWIVHRNKHGKPTSKKFFDCFVEEFFGISVTSKWMVGFNERNHFSFREPETADRSTKTEANLNSCLDFLERVKNRKKQPNQILCIDKTGLYTDVRLVKQLAPKGR